MAMTGHVHAARAAVLVCAIAAVPLRAEADVGKAWAAAKDNLPGNASMVVGVDLAAITKSQLFSTFLPMALSQQADAKKGFDLLKSKCKVDPLNVFQGVVVATDAEQKAGAAFVQLGAGMDAAKLTRCLEEVVKADGGKDAKVVVKKTGSLTELTMGKDKVYVSWIGADVFVVPFDAKDRAMLDRWTGQKGAFGRSALGKTLASVNTKAVLWGASSEAKELDGMHMKGARGALTSAAGKLGLDLNVTLENAKEAADAVAKATAGIAAAGLAPQLAPSVKTMLQQISVKAAGPEVAIRLNVAESDLAALIGSVFQP